jgi:excinuclease ABC subunit C
MFDPKPILNQLPNLPGVYRMQNQGGEVIYVGKARDLKKRVSSYFTKQHASPRTAHMVMQIANIETTITRSESEALLLENNLIKSLAPKYNVLFRDDKSYPYIMMTAHPFPQIRFYRGTHNKPHRYFGPFPSAWAVREAINHLQKVFRLRTCDDTVYAHRSRPCLLHQIGRCTAPCVGKVDAETYARDVENAALFLQGKETEVLAELNRKMEAASTELDFEQAAGFRDQIRTLQRVLTKQFVESASERDVDVIAALEMSGTWCVNLVMIRGGRHLGDKSLFPSNTRDADLEAIIGAFIDQHYGSQTPPPRLVVDGNFDTEDWEAFLNDIAGRSVKVVTHPQGESRTWMAMAMKNAQYALERQLADRASQDKKLATMREALNLENIERVECFDISHTMGEATVASCVVFDRGAMQSSEYRRYNISGITPGDDYAAMRDALTRRYRKLVEAEREEGADAAGSLAQEGGAVLPALKSIAPRPDLILIDGGKGQLGIAEEVMNELGLGDIQLIGVAKGEERKPGLETLIFGGARRELHLPSDNLGFHLIQQIRDEAHRFAITGHRARRAKKRNTSRLEDIAGIGPKKRKALLAQFGGLQGVQSASVDDLSKVDGISRELAETLYNELH